MPARAHQGRTLNPLPTTLVGRDEELALLDTLLDAAEPACLAVEGEPGIGKSRLLAELRGRAEERGRIVLAGAAAEFERDLPYGVWVEALDAFVASRELEDQELLSDLAGALPSIGGFRPAAGDERHRVHRAMRRLLAVLAQDAPLVLVLDDLHWSDEASIEMLGAFVRRGLAPGVLLALGYRTGRAPRGLRVTLRAPSVTLLELGTLDEAECRALAGDQLPAGRHAVVFRESGGNPFYALQLARAAHAPERSASADRMASDSGVPRTVAAALLDEFDALSGAGRRLLDAGAIAGDPFEPELAYEIGELEPDTGMTALDELLNTRLLHATTVPRRFAFRHPLVRRAVYESVPGGWRLAAHGRAAAALEARGVAATSRAHHVEEAAAQGDARAIAVLLEAATATAPRAPATAARWYGAALRLQPDSDPAARIATLIGLGRALASTGDLEGCVDRLNEAIELLGPGDPQLRLQLIGGCAAAEHFLGRHAAADRRLADAFDALEDPGSEEAVTLLLSRAAGAFFTLDVDGGRTLGRQAVAVAHRLGHPLLIAAAAAALAHACANAGDVEETSANADLAARHLDAAGDDALGSSLEALSRLAWAEYLIERDADTIRHAARAVAIARATGKDQFVPVALSVQAMSVLRQGDVAGATLLHEDAVETVEVSANGYMTSAILATSAWVAMARGDHESARRDAERAVELAGDAESRIATMARGRLAVTRRAQGEAADDLEALIGATPPTWAVAYSEAVVRIELAAGQPGIAEAFAARAEAAAAQLGLPLAGGLAQRARAAVLLARGDAPAAAELALASASRLDAAFPIEAALSLALAGRAHAATGERPEAVRLLRSAEATFDRRGAARDRDEARRELRRLGARAESRGPVARGGSGLASLSRRELQVAELVTDRRTNREIAATLFLSEKTVETHLRNIFAKLGASSRVEVAREVERGNQP